MPVTSIRLVRPPGERYPGELWSHYGFEPGPTGIRRRRLLVYLPGNFSPRRRCQVAYLLDGQNAFDLPEAAGGSWRAERCLEDLLEQRRVEPTILVGVCHSARRYAEFLGWADDHPDYPADPAGDRHARYLAEVVKPYIESCFKVKRSLLIGASAGGVAALYAAFRFPRAYAGVASLSAGRGFYHTLVQTLIPARLPFPVFLFCGGRGMDREFERESYEFAEILAERGDCRFVHDPKASHHEKAWSRCLPQAFEYLLQ